MNRNLIAKLALALLLVVPALSMCIPVEVPFLDKYAQVFFYLVIGWALFLCRVIPNITIDWLSVGVAAASLIGLAAGMHFFFAWLHQEIAKKRAALQTPDQEALPISPWKLRTTLAILGIFLLMFVAGISVVGGVHQLVWLKTRSGNR